MDPGWKHPGTITSWPWVFTFTIFLFISCSNFIFSSRVVYLLQDSTNSCLRSPLPEFSGLLSRHGYHFSFYDARSRRDARRLAFLYSVQCRIRWFFVFKRWVFFRLLDQTDGKYFWYIYSHVSYTWLNLYTGGVMKRIHRKLNFVIT